MTKPAATYIDGATKTSYVYRVDGNKIFPGLKWNDSPRTNTNLLITKINDKSFPELKTFMNKYVNTCPLNDLTKTIAVDHLNTFEWRNDEEKKGFVESHEGPCEIWIDNKKIFNDTNCAKHYNNYPAIINVDYSICIDKCQFEFYWMTMQEPFWQFYKACATITNSNITSKSPKMKCIEVID